MLDRDPEKVQLNLHTIMSDRVLLARLVAGGSANQIVFRPYGLFHLPFTSTYQPHAVNKLTQTNCAQTPASLPPVPHNAAKVKGVSSGGRVHRFNLVTEKQSPIDLY